MLYTKCNYILLVIFRNSVFINTIFSQKHEIKNIIVDQGTKTPIRCAASEIKKLNTDVVSNSNGEFLEIVPYSSLNDTIEFSSLGYNKKAIIIRDLLTKSRSSVELPKPFEINEIKFPSKN